MRKIFFFILFLIIGIFLSVPLVQANFFNDLEERPEEAKVVIYFFDDRLCPVCKATKDFLLKAQNDYPEIELIIYPITDKSKLEEIAQIHGKQDYSIMAPTIFIGNNFFQFRDFTSRHEKMLIRAIEGEIVEDECCIIKIPFSNIEIDISKWSLPFITIALGSLDGLNICSLSALILILSIVMIFDSKKKIFIYGGIFIFTSVIIYGVLVFAWGKLFEAMVGHLEILRIIIGLASLFGAIYFFKEFWRFFKYGPTCKASDSKLVKGATEKLKQAFKATNKGNLFLISSIIFFAAVVTIVELPCSIGLPVVFTGVLAEKNVSLLSYTLYVLLYLFFFMLDELIVFTGAVLTKKIWLAGTKTITWITFAGSLVLFYLAFYYLFS